MRHWPLQRDVDRCPSPDFGTAFVQRPRTQDPKLKNTAAAASGKGAGTGLSVLQGRRQDWRTQKALFVEQLAHTGLAYLPPLTCALGLGSHYPKVIAKSIFPWVIRLRSEAKQTLGLADTGQRAAGH